MKSVDLAIRGGQVVISGAVVEADIGITNGVIVHIGGELQADRSIEARGKLVIPGGVDAHVHLTNPGGMDIGWVDDFTSGSAAALAGGITTLGNMTFLRDGESIAAGLEREARLVEEQSIVDVFLHPVLGTYGNLTDEVIAEVDNLLDTGCNSIKFFMLFPHFDALAGKYIEATRRAGTNGLITLVHCEDYPLIEDAIIQLKRDGKSGVEYYADAHPIISEVVATQRAIAIAEATGAPVYIVHLSSQRALAACTEAQSRGVPVYVEVRPLYLHLTREKFAEPDGAKYVGNPPLRDVGDVAALWAGIQEGTIHTVCTDHAPWSLAAKLDPSLTVETARPGVENLQTMLPMLYSEGVRTGRISLGRFVEVLATNAAKLFGLYPRKGTIAVGSDADLVIFDPELTRTVELAMLKSNADYSVYDGRSVTGWPIVTIRRGEVVFQDDEVTGQPGSGRVVPRFATQRI